MSDEPEAKVLALPCWRGSLEIVSAHGGDRACAYQVKDAEGLFHVRLFQENALTREREAAAQRAAHAAGLAPRVAYAGEGALVSDFIEGRPLSATEFAHRTETVAMLLRRAHLYAGRHVLGDTSAFWVFQILRDHAHRLQATGHPLVRKCPRFLAIAEKLEEAQAPMRMAFGHNDVRPGKFIDDGVRLWITGWRRAGFGTAVFDLASLSLSGEFSAADDKRLLDAYFGGAAPPDTFRSFAAMKVAWTLRQALGAAVSSLHAPAERADHRALAARSMRKFESLYAGFQDGF